jgi:protein-L-isoaspartate(D-aspartate) O-methyltransferase
MVAAMAADGVTDPAVLAAMSAVPREVFVPHFWASGPEGRDYDLTGDHPDPPAVPLVYDMDRALAVRWDPAHPGDATSTASAPRLMAWMLELLDLRPGLRVLEIGTGTGYNVALLAEIVGDASFITSVDIDAGLVEEARGHLDPLGYGGARLLTGDGASGVPTAEPFDRVVATVGCVDLAPAWLDQLTPEGILLVPLEHGAVHPLVRARPDGAGGAAAELVGRSGFVAIRGLQAARSPWKAHRPPAAAIGRAVMGAVDVGTTSLWDLGFYVAISDRRAGLPASLDDGAGSGAAVTVGSEIAWYGKAGATLRDRLVALAYEWDGLGRPAAETFGCRFTSPAGPGELGRKGPGEWVVDRIDTRQILSLSR